MSTVFDTKYFSILTGDLPNTYIIKTIKGKTIASNISRFHAYHDDPVILIDDAKGETLYDQTGKPLPCAENANNIEYYPYSKKYRVQQKQNEEYQIYSITPKKIVSHNAQWSARRANALRAFQR